MVGMLLKFAELPFPGDRGCIARILEHASEGRFLFWIEVVVDLFLFAATDQVDPARAKSVTPGHQFDTRRRTKRRGVTVRESHPGFCERINVRRLVRSPAIAVDVFESQVVSEDEEDIGFAFGSGGG